jgi:hypothetical protein
MGIGHATDITARTPAAREARGESETRGTAGGGAQETPGVPPVCRCMPSRREGRVGVRPSLQQASFEGRPFPLSGRHACPRSYAVGACIACKQYVAVPFRFARTCMERHGG